MPIRQRDVTAEELDAARAALQKAKKKGDHDEVSHAMEVVAILRAAHREQFIDVGLRHDSQAIRIAGNGTVFVGNGVQSSTLTEEN